MTIRDGSVRDISYTIDLTNRSCFAGHDDGLPLTFDQEQPFLPSQCRQ